jgi:hypothetical protein
VVDSWRPRQGTLSVATFNDGGHQLVVAANMKDIIYFTIRKDHTIIEQK